MNILITVKTFAPLKDGVQSVTEYLAEGLLKKGHKVTVVTTRIPGIPDREDYHGLSIIRVPIYTKFALYWGNRKKYQEFILNLAQQHDVMINVATQQALTDYLYPILSKIKCIKILHMHGMYDFHWHLTDLRSLKAFVYKIWRDIRWGMLYYIKPHKFQQYDYVLQLHQFDKAHLFFKKHYGIDGHILENAAGDEFYCPNDHLKDLYAVCVANYQEIKNQEFLLEAFYKSKSSTKMQLILIGSKKTAYYLKLQKKILLLQQKCGTRNIQMLTDVSRQQTVMYVKKASVYLMSSLKEAFSISLIEAMAAGTPFISTDVGVARYLPGGIVCSTQEEMAYWLDVLYNHANIRKSLANAGKNFYRKNLTTDVKVNQLHLLITRKNNIKK